MTTLYQTHRSIFLFCVHELEAIWGGKRREYNLVTRTLKSVLTRFFLDCICEPSRPMPSIDCKENSCERLFFGTFIDRSHLFTFVHCTVKYVNALKQ